ncbi:hypothetical protein ACFX15_045421 [Malus domestica]
MSELTGILRKVQWLLMNQLLGFCYVISINEASEHHDILKGPSVSPSSAPLATSVSNSHRRWQKHFLPHAAPVALSTSFSCSCYCYITSGSLSKSIPN